MKKISLLLLGIALALGSCKKDDDPIQENTNDKVVFEIKVISSGPIKVEWNFRNEPFIIDVSESVKYTTQMSDKDFDRKFTLPKGSSYRVRVESLDDQNFKTELLSDGKVINEKEGAKIDVYGRLAAFKL